MDLEKAEVAIADLLLALGVDEGDHTDGTPRRVARAWAEMLGGYAEQPGAHLERTFSAPPVPGLVMQSGIRVVSWCAHHMLPIVGTATVAYRPRDGQPVVGLSKLARVVDGFARRLQVQEQLGYQVAQTVAEVLDPVGAACLITAAHGCMTLRGINQHAAVTTSESWAGDWLTLPDTAAERRAVEHDRAATTNEHNRSVAGFKGGAVW